MEELDAWQRVRVDMSASLGLLDVDVADGEEVESGNESGIGEGVGGEETLKN
jgi:hypothetical protein